MFGGIAAFLGKKNTSENMDDGENSNGNNKKRKLDEEDADDMKKSKVEDNDETGEESKKKSEDGGQGGAPSMDESANESTERLPQESETNGGAADKENEEKKEEVAEKEGGDGKYDGTGTGDDAGKPDPDKPDPDAPSSAEAEEKDGEDDSNKKKVNPYDRLRFCVVENDGKPDSCVKLIGLKSLFAKQLPKMPRPYIARLVFDRRHKSLAILSSDPQHKGGDEEIIGAICYRGFSEMRFAEIAFCAVNSSHQVKVRTLWTSSNFMCLSVAHACILAYFNRDTERSS